MRENNRYVIVNTERTRKRRKKRQLCLTIAVITVMLMAGVTVCATELSKKTVHITVDDSESGKEQAMETLETLQNAQRVQEAQVIPEEEDDVEENVERKPITKDGYDYSRPVPESSLSGPMEKQAPAGAHQQLGGHLFRFQPGKAAGSGERGGGCGHRAFCAG